MKEMIRMGESSVLEFKAEDVHNDSIAKEVAAFSNFMGGRLLVGVGDDGSIVGTTDRKVEERIVQICRNNVTPSVLPRTEFVEIDGREILVVEIPKGLNKPYRVKTTGKFYVRAGSSSVEPTNEELARLFQDGEMIHYETKPVYGAGVNDLNRGYLNQYLREFRRIDEFPEEAYPQVLENLNLAARVNGDCVPTIAGLILFGTNPKKFLPQSICQAVCFKGTDESTDIVELKEFSGAVTEVMEGLLRFVERNSRTEVAFENGIKRNDLEQYPGPIVRELMANAIAHRDYSIWGAFNRLMIFNDRLEMRSPGTLPNTITVERMRWGVSYYRNPIIMQTLKDFGYVESIGRGIIRCNRQLKALNRKELEIVDLGAELRVVVWSE
jgi:ATP-dependent DNA helicase RecG